MRKPVVGLGALDLRGCSGTRYAASTLRAAATCLVAVAFVATPWVISFCAASAPTSDAALRSAIAVGDQSAMARAVADGARVNGRDSLGLSPLSDAIGHGRPEVVGWLLAHGADANGRVLGAATPLYLALGRGDPAIVRLLLRAGADVNARLPNGTTPLLAACARGGEDGVLAVVDALLNAGADPNAADAGGRRPLACAADAGHARVVSRLIAAGAR